MHPSLWVLLLFVLIVVLGVVIWSIRRHHDPNLQTECDLPIDRLIPSLS